MARATTAEVKKLFLGEWPPGVSDGVVDSLLDGADYVLDAYVKKHYEASLSTTDTSVVHIANLLVEREIIKGLWRLSGGTTTGQPEPERFTEDIVLLIEAVLSDTTSDGFSSVSMQGSYSDS